MKAFFFERATSIKYRPEAYIIAHDQSPSVVQEKRTSAALEK
jgi:hypothetical protein